MRSIEILIFFIDLFRNKLFLGIYFLTSYFGKFLDNHFLGIFWRIVPYLVEGESLGLLNLQNCVFLALKNDTRSCYSLLFAPTLH